VLPGSHPWPITGYSDITGILTRVRVGDKPTTTLANFTSHRQKPGIALYALYCALS